MLRSPAAAEDLARRLAGVYRLLMNKYYVDEVYDALIVRPAADGFQGYSLARVSMLG